MNYRQIQIAAKAIFDIEKNISTKQYLPDSESGDINVSAFKRPDNLDLVIRLIIGSSAPDVIQAMQAAYYNVNEYPSIIYTFSDTMGMLSGLINDYAIENRTDLRDAIDFINSACDRLDEAASRFHITYEEFLSLSETDLSERFEVVKSSLRDITDEIHDILISIEDFFDLPVNLSMDFDYPAVIS